MIRLTATFDQSGYGNAARDTLLALVHAGLNVSTNMIVTPMSRQEAASCPGYDEVIKHLNPNAKAKVNIIELIPPLWHYGLQKNTKNFGYFFWETDKIPADWTKIINESIVDEVWVPCESNKRACLNGGVTKPVYVVPQYTKTNIVTEERAKQLLPIPGDAYKFYSIFQYTKRKNPEGLINAYLSEFTAEDNVMLVVKTYGPSSFSDRRWIKEAIQDMKAQYEDAPPIFLFGELLKPEQVDAIHAQCQCYIHAGIGEGWNIPLIDAMAYNRQTITTKLGGIADWIVDSSYVIPHTMVNVDNTGMPWGGFYTPDQKWGKVKTEEIQEAMRQAYNERNDFSWRTDKYKDILKICDEKNVISLIKERLAKIL